MQKHKNKRIQIRNFSLFIIILASTHTEWLFAVRRSPFAFHKPRRSSVFRRNISSNHHKRKTFEFSVRSVRLDRLLFCIQMNWMPFNFLTHPNNIQFLGKWFLTISLSFKKIGNYSTFPTWKIAELRAP